MGAAILKQPIRGRGTSNPSINSANPLSRGLCAVSIPVGGQVVTLTQGGLSDRFATKSGPAAITQGSMQALSVAYSSITTDSWRLIETANRLDTVFERPSSAVTAVAFVMRRGNNPNGTAPIFLRGSAVTSPYAAYSILDYSGTGTLRGTVAIGGTSYSATGSIIPNMRPIVLSTRYDGSKVEIFMGGVLNGSLNCSGTLSYPNASDSGVAIGNYYSYSATARSFNGDVYLTAVWDRALSDTELRSISENPYQILRPANDRLWLDVVAGGGGVSGSLSAIDAPDTASFSGSASAPSVTGTLSATDAQDAASFAGSLIFSGSLAATEPPDVATFTGTAYAPGVSGTLAATDIADTAVFTGALSFVGALAAVEAQDSAAAAGAFGPSGSLVATDQPDSATFSGSHASGVAGHLAAADQTDVSAFAGAVDNGGLAIVVSHQRVLIVPPQSRALTIAPQSRVLTIQGE